MIFKKAKNQFMFRKATEEIPTPDWDSVFPKDIKKIIREKHENALKESYDVDANYEPAYNWGEIEDSLIIQPSGRIDSLRAHHGPHVSDLFSGLPEEHENNYYNLGTYHTISHLFNGGIRVFVTEESISISLFALPTEAQLQALYRIHAALGGDHTIKVDFRFTKEDGTKVSDYVRVNSVSELRAILKNFSNKEAHERLQKIRQFRDPFYSEIEKVNIPEKKRPDFTQSEIQDISKIPVPPMKYRSASIFKSAQNEVLTPDWNSQIPKDKKERFQVRHDILTPNRYLPTHNPAIQNNSTSLIVQPDGTIDKLEEGHWSHMINVLDQDDDIVDDLGTYETIGHVFDGAIRVYVDDIGEINISFLHLPNEAQMNAFYKIFMALGGRQIVVDGALQMKNGTKQYLDYRATNFEDFKNFLKNYSDTATHERLQKLRQFKDPFYSQTEKPQTPEKEKQDFTQSEMQNISQMPINRKIERSASTQDDLMRESHMDIHPQIKENFIQASDALIAQKHGPEVEKPEYYRQPRVGISLIVREDGTIDELPYYHKSHFEHVWRDMPDDDENRKVKDMIYSKGINRGISYLFNGIRVYVNGNFIDITALHLPNKAQVSSFKRVQNGAPGSTFRLHGKITTPEGQKELSLETSDFQILKNYIESFRKKPMDEKQHERLQKLRQFRDPLYDQKSPVFLPPRKRPDFTQSEISNLSKMPVPQMKYREAQKQTEVQTPDWNQYFDQEYKDEAKQKHDSLIYHRHPVEKPYNRSQEYNESGTSLIVMPDGTIDTLKTFHSTHVKAITRKPNEFGLGTDLAIAHLFSGGIRVHTNGQVMYVTLVHVPNKAQINALQKIFQSKNYFKINVDCAFLGEDEPMPFRDFHKFPEFENFLNNYSDRESHERLQKMRQFRDPLFDQKEKVNIQKKQQDFTQSEISNLSKMPVPQMKYREAHTIANLIKLAEALEDQRLYAEADEITSLTNDFVDSRSL